VVAAGSVTAAIATARTHAPGLPCEVEVTSHAELDEALAAGATDILLDNMSPAQCAAAVRRVRELGAATTLEASGGLTLDVARRYAETGVDYLAVGAVTHSAPALDLGMDLEDS
jgi:nicotinate-nucleotide pyrophosphorylase (carboxylating)